VVGFQDPDGARGPVAIRVNHRVDTARVKLNLHGDAEIVLKSLNAVYSIFDREVQSTASIGIVTSEQCALSAEEIVRNADVAMYVAKRSGGGCAVVFDEAMQTRAARHLAIETSLGKAIGGSELYRTHGFRRGAAATLKGIFSAVPCAPIGSSMGSKGTSRLRVPGIMSNRILRRTMMQREG
jgi:hypothetical protein